MTALGNRRGGGARRRGRLAPLAIVAAMLAAVSVGCASVKRAPLPSLGESNPAALVFAHCRELVCSHAAVPNCEFTDYHQGSGTFVEEEHVRCSRDGDFLACEGQRSAQTGNRELLRFRCAGDPLKCEVTRGAAAWKAAVAASAGGSQRLSCHAAPAGPAPEFHAIPSPDTAARSRPARSAGVVSMRPIG